MAHEIYVDPRQNGSAVGSSWWFEFPSELQAAVDYYVEMHVMDDIEAVADAADDVVTTVEGYSNNLWMRVGSRRYNLYRNCGVYRMGAGGEDGTAKGCIPEDKDRLIAHFQELENDLLLA